MSGSLTELDELEAAAKAATPGPWGVRSFCHCDERDDAPDEMDPDHERDHWMVDAAWPDRPGPAWARVVCEQVSTADAEYIALANPQTVLSLLSQLREARRLLTETDSVEAVEAYLYKQRAEKAEVELREARAAQQDNDYMMVASRAEIGFLTAIRERAEQIAEKHAEHWYEQDAMTETCVCQRRWPCDEGRVARFILGAAPSPEPPPDRLPPPVKVSDAEARYIVSDARSTFTPAEALATARRLRERKP